jgi:hypothetical protein
MKSKVDSRFALSQTTTALLAALLAVTGLARAEETPAKTDASATDKKDAPAEKPAPLPLHQIEGNGGIFSTLSAYIVNPPRNGEWIGRPSVGFSYVNLDHGRNLDAFTITESPWKRLEIGYAYNRFDLGDLPQDIERATTIRISRDSVTQHNLNARLQVLKEGEFDTKWVPALTLGVHGKINEDINQIDKDLAGTLSSVGLKHDSGADFTVYASKLLTFLPRPVLINVGGRATEGAQLGLLGYTDNYSFVFEGNVVVFVTGNFALAAEYKQKPNDYKTVGSLVGKEDDWWTIDAAYVVNKHLTLAAGYGHFGQVLNHESNGVWGLTTKWEF